MVGEPPDIIPGKKYSIWPPVIVALIMTGLVWVVYGYLQYNFSFGIQLFVVSLATVLVVPPLLARFGTTRRFPFILALVQAGIISLVTALILVAQGFWITTDGTFQPNVLLTGASLTISVVAFVIAYISHKWDIVI